MWAVVSGGRGPATTLCVCVREYLCVSGGVLEGRAVDVHFKGNRFNQISKSGTACDVGETE